MFTSVLIANRGVCAARIMRTAQALGLRVVAVVVADDDAHAGAADSVVVVPSYLDEAAIVAAAVAEGVDAVHPGYGFLAENESFARAVTAANIVFIGPSPDQMAAFATKHAARALAIDAGVQTVPGSGLVASLDEARAAAVAVGYPVLLKSTAGGGGTGQAVVENEPDLAAAFDRVCRLADRLFHDDRVFVEAWVPEARHVEVQIFGTGSGAVVALGDRDCSAQRRNQKVLEEAPAPGLSPTLRRAMSEAAVRLCERAGYVNAGTVEFLVDVGRGGDAFYFLEVNTRLQVEHAVTEQILGIDIVEAQLRTAAGLPVPAIIAAAAAIAAGELQRHSIQARVYAEDAARDFAPSSGLLTRVEWPSPSHAPGLRLETCIERAGVRVSPLYDPMIAKVVVTAPTRDDALDAMAHALDGVRLDGVETNVPFLRALVRESDALRDGRLLTRDLPLFPYLSHTAAVTAAPGGSAIVVDLGRPGLWKAGIPPSGASDDLALRAANHLVGNDADAAALELVLEGVELRFACAARVAITGARPTPLTVDDIAVEPWTAIDVPAGSVLLVGKLRGPGARAYVSVAGGGFDVPPYLGSRTTFLLGAFGGHQGRGLRAGDVLRLFPGCAPTVPPPPPPGPPPIYTNSWRVGVLEGPHSVGFMESADFVLDVPLRVHYNSNRLGVRLEDAPAPTWVRADGGDAGLHPSNVLDTVYSHNAVNITGELPVFLGVDGPSLGGFVCPVVVCRAEAWKLGQVRPGDTVEFYRVARADALEARARMEATPQDVTLPRAHEREDPVLMRLESADGAAEARVLARLAGEDAILVEFGRDDIIDLPLRLKVRALNDALTRRFGSGRLRELSPGVRSLHVQFDPAALDIADLLAAVADLTTTMPIPRRVPSRVLHMPLAFDASTTRAALKRYAAGVRAEAPYLPSNIDFIARINGCDVAAVKDAVFTASYLVLGLGDVYLGAPCALAVDPRHRMVTTKMNPARVWTAEGEVGLGGSFMCVYGMDSPGGYQLVGRTMQMWSTWATGRDPWLLREFDEVRFYQVSEAELDAARAAFARGDTTALRVEEAVFDIDAYAALLDGNADDIAADRDRKRAAFLAERERWAEAEAAAPPPPCSDAAPVTLAVDESSWPDGAVAVRAPVAGRFVPAAAAGATATQGERLAIVEAMKLEFGVESPLSEVPLAVLSILVPAGALVDQGDVLMLLHASDAADLPPPTTVDEVKSSLPPRSPLAVDLSRLAALRDAYADGSATPTLVVSEAARRACDVGAAFLYIAPHAELVARCSALEAKPSHARGEMYGVPFAVKDNIDVEGMPTTAACPAAVDLTPAAASAAVVERLLAADAVCIGKTNMDQWAAGLTGQRSPTGPIACAADAAYISGGSSSGSGIAVAAGVVTFALGTDTAGSGRVPAALNGVIGYKPTRGLLSARGVLPACASLDCVSVFASSCDDARRVARVASGWDAEDAYSRRATLPAVPAAAGPAFRFGVLASVEAAGVVSDEVRALLASSVDAAEAAGGTRVDVDADDTKLLLRAAALLYAEHSPWLAERVDAINDVVSRAGWEALHPVTARVLRGAVEQRTVDAWPLLHELAAIRAAVEERVWPCCDVLLLPTVPRTFTLAQVEADPIGTNAVLGTYTNFANLLDCAAVAIPAGTLSGGRAPWGVQLVAPAWSDDALLELGQLLHARTVPDARLTLTSDACARDLVPLLADCRLFGSATKAVTAAAVEAAQSKSLSDVSDMTEAALDGSDGSAATSADASTVDLFVVGLHMDGLPLNNQLRERGATLVRAASTAPEYTLHALAGGAKPGLVRGGGGSGTAIDGEVWRVPVERFGSFVVECVPPPLCVGSVLLDDGDWVKGFLCEAIGACAAAGACDITALGGWRAYVSAKEG